MVVLITARVDEVPSISASRRSVWVIYLLLVGWYGVVDQFDHLVIGEYLFIVVRGVLVYLVQVFGDVFFDVVIVEYVVFGVEVDDFGNWLVDVDQFFGVFEQFQVVVILGHQVQVLVDHADVLSDVLDRVLQQGAVELQYLVGFVDDAYHVFDLYFAAFDGRFDHRAG